MLLSDVIVQVAIPGTSVQAVLTGNGLMVVLCTLGSIGIYLRDIATREIPPPIASWGLWLIINVLAWSAELTRGVFSIQMFVYIVGSAVVCYKLMRRPNRSFDGVWDTATAVAVASAIWLWFYSGNALVGLWMSVLAILIASIPLIRGLYRFVIRDEPLTAWILVFIGCVFSYREGLIITATVIGMLQIVFIALILRIKLTTLYENALDGVTGE
jgi:hypothetical protein